MLGLAAHYLNYLSREWLFTETRFVKEPIAFTAPFKRKKKKIVSDIFLCIAFSKAPFYKYHKANENILFDKSSPT